MARRLARANKRRSLCLFHASGYQVLHVKLKLFDETYQAYVLSEVWAELTDGTQSSLECTPERDTKNSDIVAFNYSTRQNTSVSISFSAGSRVSTERAV